ncbi:MAG: hypothetical protein K2J77_06750 [Oscillospiraceae bacterium]|nr:hypothetical protein [Oscillospiraceae bacterium]
MKRLKYGVILAAALSVLFCGCSAIIGESSGISEISKPFTYGISKEYWKSTSYSMDDIKAKVHPTLFNDEREFKPDDYSDDALRAYNSMLGYAERLIGTDYYVYDYYYADWTNPPHSWVIKIVPYEMARTAESENRRLYIDEPICLFYGEDGSSVQSCLEPYFMERKWFDDLSRELTESFPDYKTELRISEFQAIYPNVLETQFDDPSDYTYIINDSFYDRRDEWEYGNVITVILPSDTEQDSAAEVFERIKPLLTRYCVTEVNICTLTDEEYIDWEESFTIK